MADPKLKSAVPSKSSGMPPPPAKKPGRKMMTVGQTIASSTCKYTVLSVLGSGGFGDVYKVQKEGDTSSVSYALKTEDANISELRLRRLKVEAEVLSACGNSKKPHFIGLVDMGATKEFKFVVMPVVWHSLEKIRTDVINTKEYSRMTAQKICVQLLESVRDLHQLGWLHRDLKPANFAVGLAPADRQTVYILDFGVGRKFEKNGKVLNAREKVRFMGTRRYASRAGHRLMDQARKDDVESLTYVMADIFDSMFLPWRGLGNLQTVVQLKDEFMTRTGPIVAKMFEFMPPSMEQIVKYVETLEFHSDPNYDMMIDAMKGGVGGNTDPMDWHGLDARPKKEKEAEAKKAAKKAERTRQDPTVDMEDVENKKAQPSSSVPEQ